LFKTVDYRDFRDLQAAKRKIRQAGTRKTEALLTVRHREYKILAGTSSRHRSVRHSSVLNYGKSLAEQNSIGGPRFSWRRECSATARPYHDVEVRTTLDSALALIEAVFPCPCYTRVPKPLPRSKVRVFHEGWHYV
jgi:hypothetical protein